MNIQIHEETTTTELIQLAMHKFGIEVRCLLISANETKWIEGDYEIGRSVRLCVCLSVYTNWLRYAL